MTKEWIPKLGLLENMSISSAYPIGTNFHRMYILQMKNLAVIWDFSFTNGSVPTISWAR